MKSTTPDDATSSGDAVAPIDGYSTAAAMGRALRSREISSVELLDLHLRRIERHNPRLNVLVTPNFEGARAAAEDADRLRARGDERPLLGLPITVKDCLYTKGLVATGGVPERKDAVSEEDAPIVARARAAGVAIMGKTNVPPYAADWQSDNPVFGRSNNPWDLDRTPGGSTGGGAAALAAGLTPLELGGDLSGSIRIPAAFCGVYGHKPSESILKSVGHFPGPNFPNPSLVLAVNGPLARSAGDLELAMETIAGPTPGEEVAWLLEPPSSRRDRLSEFRVAVLPPVSWIEVDDEIRSALETLAGRLSGAGAVVAETGPEALGDGRDYYRTYVSIMSAMTSARQPPEERQREIGRLRERGDVHSMGWADGLMASAGDYIGWLSRREGYRAAFRTFFREWDVLLTPISLTPAFTHRTKDDSDWSLAVNGTRVEYALQLFYPGLCNLSGHPGTAFPAGLTRSGLPIGLQAIGPYLEDRTPLRFARLLEETFGGFQRPPGFD